jgi:DNA polymerase-3 subunit delta'
MFEALIEKGRLPHALLLTGRDKKALETAASDLASKLAQGPDLFEFHPQGKLALHTVEAMNTLKQEAILPCYLGDKKVFVLYEIDRILPQASNSLLKVFEEPPPGIYFIMTTENKEKTLPTIISRCQIFRIPGQPQERPLSPSLEAFLKTKRYTDCRPFFAAIKTIAEEVDAEEDPLVFQKKAEELFEALEHRHPGKGPYFEEARLKLSRSTALSVILESLFIKLGYL